MGHLVLTQAANARSSQIDRPRHMIKSGAVVRHNVSQPECPFGRWRGNRSHGEHDGVGVGVIAGNDWVCHEWIAIGAIGEAVFQTLCVDAAPLPLPPRTIKLAHWSSVL